MTTNLLLNETGTEPIRIEDEYFILKRNDISYSIITDLKAQYTGEGYLILSSNRLVIFPLKQNTHFRAIEIPLNKIYQEEFKQPLFGKSYITARCYQIFASSFGGFSFTIWFKGSRMGTLIGAFFTLLDSLRNNQGQFHDEKVINCLKENNFNELFAIDLEDNSLIYQIQPPSAKIPKRNFQSEIIIRPPDINNFNNQDNNNISNYNINLNNNIQLNEEQIKRKNDIYMSTFIYRNPNNNKFIYKDPGFEYRNPNNVNNNEDDLVNPYNPKENNNRIINNLNNNNFITIQKSNIRNSNIIQNPYIRNNNQNNNIQNPYMRNNNQNNNNIQNRQNQNNNNNIQNPYMMNNNQNNTQRIQNNHVQNNYLNNNINNNPNNMNNINDLNNPYMMNNQNNMNIRNPYVQNNNPNISNNNIQNLPQLRQNYDSKNRMNLNNNINNNVNNNINNNINFKNINSNQIKNPYIQIENKPINNENEKLNNRGPQYKNVKKGSLKGQYQNLKEEENYDENIINKENYSINNYGDFSESNIHLESSRDDNLLSRLNSDDLIPDSNVENPYS